MAQATQLKKTGQRIKKHAQQFAQQTRAAGVELFTTSRDATVEFATELGNAGGQFVEQTTTSTTDLGQALADETKVLADMAKATGRTYTEQAKTYTEQTKTRLNVARFAPWGDRAKAGSKKVKTEAKAPIKNYDALTAKDVVSRIQRLSGPQASAVLDYEKARKKRATVIRAAQQRLKAAG